MIRFLKKKFYILVLLSVGFKATCQVLSVSGIRNYQRITFADYFSKKPTFAFRNDTIIAFNEFTLTIFPGDKPPQTLDLESLLNKEDKKKISKDYGFSHWLSGALLIIQCKNHAFLFNYEGTKTKFRECITLSENYCGNIYCIDNIIYFYKIHNYHPKDSHLPSGFLAYDLLTGKEVIHEIPFDYLAMTHVGPNHFIDFRKTGYMVCDPLRYIIYEYDFNHTLVDMISVQDSAFTRSDANAFKEKFKAKYFFESSHDYLGDMTSYLKTIDRIWTINYLNDTTLFVRLTRNTLNTTSNKRELFYDHIWVKKKNKWTLVQSNPITTFNPLRLIQKEELWPQFYPGSKNSFGNDALYYTLWSSSENTFPINGEHFFGFDAVDRKKLSLKLIEFKVR